jgi:hypothetical protein
MKKVKDPWPDLGDKYNLSERYTLVISPELARDLRTLKNSYRKDVNQRVRQVLREELDAFLRRVGDLEPDKASK